VNRTAKYHWKEAPPLAFCQIPPQSEEISHPFSIFEYFLLIL
jgi:hypothetical protein